jgi:PAS domain S-box-containing protein
MTTTDLMVGSHDYRFVLLSIVISILAAYAARNLAERVRDARGGAWLAWLVGGATADGIGIWSMHYTAMLGFSLPVSVLYDWPTVLLSLLFGIIGAGAALIAANRSNIGWLQAWGAGVFMGGVGISGLHYTAMSAMRMEAMHHYSSPALVILSIVLAIMLSSLALALTFVVRDRRASRSLRIHGSALLRGAANPVMHYTAMAAVSFTLAPKGPELNHTISISSIGMIGISIVPIMVLVVVILTSVMDRLRRQRALLDELFEQAPQAVALIDANDRVFRVNQEFTRLFGYTPQETLGRILSDLTVPDELRGEYERYAGLSAQGQRVDAEAVRKRKDGSRLHVSVIRVLVSVPGREVGVYAIYRDITERKRAEDALRSSQEQLRALAAYLQSVREKERTRIARELHDEIGQGLTAIKLALQRSTAGQSGAAVDLVQALDLAKELIGRVRDLSLELRPAMLDDLGLLAALRWHFERYTVQCKIDVDFKYTGLDDRRFSPEIETAAYRIVQEALTNVARHAGVDQVVVEIDADQDQLRIQVIDRGAGFDPHSLSAARTAGLSGMRERAIILGGKLDVQSSLGAGTVLTATLPLNIKTASA